MHILFIGGTGNISTACAKLLHERGHNISVLTRGRNPVPDNYENLVADRHDADSMRRAIGAREFDSVIDFLGFEAPDMDTCLEVFRGRLRQFIFISTCVVYKQPGRSLPVTELTPKGNTLSEYGRRKHACEERLLEAHDLDSFPVTIVRPSHTYSESWIPNPVSSAGYTFAARLEAGKPVFVHDDGQGLWTLTTTADFAVGLAGLVGNPAALGEDFQITSDEVLTWNQIYAEIINSLGIASPMIYHIPTEFICGTCPTLAGGLAGDKAHHAVFDNAKIKRTVPDFQCRTPFRDGIREVISWFNADPTRKTVRPDVDAIFDQVINAWLQR